VQLDEPGRPVIRDVGEDRDRPDQVERRCCERKRGLFLVSEDLEGRAQVGTEPGDARTVDVAAEERSDLRLLEEVAERSPGPAAEVEHALSVERPARRQQGEDLRADASTDLLVQTKSAP